MTKELLRQLAAYNHWANRQLLDTIRALPEEKIRKEVASSFPGLLSTILHMWNAESVWWQRVKLAEHVRYPGNEFSGSPADAISGLLQQSGQWEEWVKSASVNVLDHVIHYQNKKGDLEKIQTSQLLLHVFNHSTYHRGQLVTILHQLGHKKIPGTDYVLWTRLKK